MLEQIKNTIKLTTDIYLEKHFPRIPENKKQIAINAYEKDIERLANFVYNFGFFNDDFLLTQEFIKGFHKNLYPENFTQKGKDKNGVEIVWLIPGEYKKIDNFSDSKDKIKFFGDLPGWTEEKSQYTKFNMVEEKMIELINIFNKNYFDNNNLNKKKDLVFLFIFDLIGIHPFSDGNGRIAGILLDLYLIKLGFKAIGLKTIVSKDKLTGDRIIFLVQDQRNLKYIYDFIEKYNGTI